MKKTMVIIPVIIALILVVLSFILIYFFIPLASYPESKADIVVNVIDGDTFEYYEDVTKTIKTVRLLCVDTPEVSEEGYEEAKAFLEDLLLGKSIVLEEGITLIDKYDRLLRYVYLNESENLVFVNQLILDNNYGELLIISPETCEKMDK